MNIPLKPTIRVRGGLSSSPKITPKRLRSAVIRYLLNIRGLTFAGLSRRLRPRIREGALQAVARGDFKSRRLQQALADALGKSFVELWGAEPRPRGWPKGRPRKAAKKETKA
jgi:hypothetical protein